MQQSLKDSGLRNPCDPLIIPILFPHSSPFYPLTWLSVGEGGEQDERTDTFSIRVISTLSQELNLQLRFPTPLCWTLECKIEWGLRGYPTLLREPSSSSFSLNMPTVIHGPLHLAPNTTPEPLC